jgi:ATP-binding protein involved in chromosome partitioning
MFQRVNTPVLGILENMSGYVCPNCGREEALFGSGGGARIADDFGVPLLGKIPLVPEIRVGGDAGKPIVVERPEDPVSRIFLDIARLILHLMDLARNRAPSQRMTS